MAIASVSQVKAHIGITGTQHDAVLATWINQCEAALSRLLKRQLSQVTITEYQSGTGDSTMWLRATPVQSITSLFLDNNGYGGQAPEAFGADTELLQGVDFYLDHDLPQSGGAVKSLSGKLVRIGRRWDRPLKNIGLLNSVPSDGSSNIKITYVAGWAESEAPDDLTLALIQMVTQIKSNRGDGMPLQSEGMDYYNYSRISPADMHKVIGSVESLVKPWKRIVI